MTNLAFTALIKSNGYNKQRLADVCGLSKTQMSNRINGANDWRWPEVGKACAALGITLDEFATYYPVADVRKSSAAMPTRAERIDSVLAELREILMEQQLSQETKGNSMEMHRVATELLR